MTLTADAFRPLPADAAPRTRAAEMDFIVKVFTIEMVIVVVTQKIAVPIGSAETSQVALALLVHAGVLVLLAMRGVLRISRLSLMLFCGFTAMAGFSAVVLANPSYSVMSLLLLIIISVFYTFRVHLDWEHYLKWLANFQLIAVGAAALLFFNWATQFIGLGLVDLNSMIPRKLLYLHYNYIQPIHWGSPWMKPNAVFFLETSHISQFIAMAIVIELTCFFRVRYLAFFGAALLASFGGTGMLTLALSVPFLLGRVPRGLILAGVLALPIAYVGASSIGLTSNIESRVGEFGSRGTSGEMRFSRPAEAVVDAMFGDEADLFIGKGAGSMPKGQSIRRSEFRLGTLCKGLRGVRDRRVHFLGASHTHRDVRPRHAVRHFMGGVPSVPVHERLAERPSAHDLRHAAGRRRRGDGARGADAEWPIWPAASGRRAAPFDGRPSMTRV